MTPIFMTGLACARARNAGSTADAVAADSAARRVRRIGSSLPVNGSQADHIMRVLDLLKRGLRFEDWRPKRVAGLLEKRRGHQRRPIAVNRPGDLYADRQS